jgi:two-component system response regulator HydG
VRVDYRILCATNQDSAAKIKAGSFRKELYYRLGVVTVRLPGLRERPEDIPHLARFFLERFSRRYGKNLTGSAAFYETLLGHPWPGNVRQLKNVMEKLVALHPGGVLEPGDLEMRIPGQAATLPTGIPRFPNICPKATRRIWSGPPLG